MKTATLLLAIAVTAALIALVAVNVRIRDLQHQMHQQRKRIARLKHEVKVKGHESCGRSDQGIRGRRYSQYE